MERRIKVISLIFLLLAAGSLPVWLTTRWLARAQSQENVKDRGPFPEPYAQVDEKAGAVKDADERAIRDLTDALLPLIIGDNVPDVLIKPYKERLVRAEVNYRGGHKEGLPEANVVRVIDELARKFNAPDYARTDEDEVRDVRLAISHMMPHFIVHQPLGAGVRAESSTEVPYTVNPTMSPLEAVYVTRFLIMQKEINESSHITPAERAEIKARVKRLEEEGFQLTWRERGDVTRALIEQRMHPEKPQLTAEELATRAQQQRAERAGNQIKAYLRSGPSSARYEEMREVFRRAYRIKLSDAIALTNRALELLGIEN